MLCPGLRSVYSACFTGKQCDRPLYRRVSSFVQTVEIFQVQLQGGPQVVGSESESNLIKLLSLNQPVSKDASELQLHFLLAIAVTA